jgi:hypothetical protein
LYWKKRQGQETFSLLRENDYARILPIQFTKCLSNFHIDLKLN